jgi:hypothetical protein
MQKMNSTHLLSTSQTLYIHNVKYFFQGSKRKPKSCLPQKSKHKNLAENHKRKPLCILSGIQRERISSHGLLSYQKNRELQKILCHYRSKIRARGTKKTVPTSCL